MNTISLSKNLNFEMTSEERLALKLRFWQMEINERLKKSSFKIPVHLGLGTEALVVAVDKAMKANDNLLLTHRNAAFNLIRAINPKSVTHEYEGLRNGFALGHLGSMNLANPERGIVYSSSILANNISVACGFAFGQRFSNNNSVTIVLTGDGAIEEGAFYEGLIFARSHNLPLIVIIDNNNYSMASMIHERRCEIEFSEFCKSIDVNYLRLESNDVQAYSSEICASRELSEVTKTPLVIEANTSLLNQHAGPTPGWPTDTMQVDFRNGLVILENSNDPIFLIKQKYGQNYFSSIESEILHELMQEG